MPNLLPMLKPLLLLSPAIMAMDILPIIMEDIMDIIMARDLPSQVMDTTAMPTLMPTTAMDTDIIMARGLLSLDMATMDMVMVMGTVTASDMDTMDIMDTENRCIAQFLKSSDVNKKY